MTRQSWRLIVGAGWCVSLLSACAQTNNLLTKTDCRPTVQKAPLAIPGPAQGGQEEQEPKGPPRDSPYHLIPPPPVVKEQSAQEPPLLHPPALTEVAQPKPPMPPVHEQPTGVAPSVQNVLAQHVVPPEEASRLVIALNHFLKDQVKDAAAALTGYSPQTQLYLMQVLPMLAKLENKSIEKLNAEEVEQLQGQLESLVQSLRGRGELVIDKMCFCKRIGGYGEYDPLPADHAFQPTTRQGRPGDLVQLYLELRNFAIERRDNYFITCLDTSVELHREGETRESWKRSLLDGGMLRSLAPRHDCFNRYTFCVPFVPPGRYKLTIQIVDQTNRPARTARKTIDFIVAEPAASPSP